MFVFQCNPPKAVECQDAVPGSLEPSAGAMERERASASVLRWVVVNRVGLPLRSPCLILHLSLACLADQYSRPIPA